MEIFNRIVSYFKRHSYFVCGGEGAIEVIKNGKFCGIIYYRRPTSDEKLDYFYCMQKEIGTELQLKEIKNAKDKNKKCHEIILRDVSIPFAEKIFLRAEKFKGDKDNTIESKTPSKQFELLKLYWSNILVDLVSIAYEIEGIVKKKY